MAPSSAGPGRPWPHDNRRGSNLTGEQSSSTKRWNDVPRGTMDEVSSYVRLEPAVSLTARPTNRLFHLVFEPHDGRAPVPIPKRSASPQATSTTAEVDSLKVLDPERSIREADIRGCRLSRSRPRVPRTIKNGFSRSGGKED